MSEKWRCKACRDSAWDTPEKERTVAGRSSADYCKTCFLELTEGKIPLVGNIAIFNASGYEYLSEGQRHGRSHTTR